MLDRSAVKRRMKDDRCQAFGEARACFEQSRFKQERFDVGARIVARGRQRRGPFLFPLHDGNISLACGSLFWDRDGD